MTAEKSGDGLVTGAALATPSERARQKVAELIGPAAETLANALKTSSLAFEKGAQAVVWSKQVDVAMQVLQACMDMTGGNEQKDAKSAAKILAAVGGDAVTRELSRRYALRERMSERARIVEAVPARLEVAAKDTVQPMAAEADSCTDVSVARETQSERDTSTLDTPAADGGDTP